MRACRSSTASRRMIRSGGLFFFAGSSDRGVPPRRRSALEARDENPPAVSPIRAKPPVTSVREPSARDPIPGTILRYDKYAARDTKESTASLTNRFVCKDNTFDGDAQAGRDSRARHGQRSSQCRLASSPLRSRLLALARDPVSSSDLARRVGLPRQRVNYHVRALEAAGFLKPAGRQRKRNMIEQRYVATARAFVLSPAVLGPVGADWREIGDPASADYLLALTEQVRGDLVRVHEDAEAGGGGAATLSLKAQFRFESPASARSSRGRSGRRSSPSSRGTPTRTAWKTAGPAGGRLSASCWPAIPRRRNPVRTKRNGPGDEGAAMIGQISSRWGPR